MPDPRQYVRPGQRLQIAASQINAVNEMMRVDTGFRAGPVSRQASSPYTWVYGKSSSAVSRWGVMAITGMEVTPTSDDNADATKQFQSMPVLTLGATSSSTTAWCVAIEPIAANKIGRVAVSGAVQIKASDLPKASGATVLWKDTNWALVVAGGREPRLGTISATWTKNATATVTQIQADGSALSPAVTFSATNYFATVTVASGTKKVLCVFVGDRWLLVAAEC